MKFNRAFMKSLKADIAKAEITIAFTVSLSGMDMVETLRPYCDGEANAITVEIGPYQIPLWDSMISKGKVETRVLLSENEDQDGEA